MNDRQRSSQRITRNGQYRIISSGADSTFEPDSRRIVLDGRYDVRYSDRPEDDLIYGDGVWIQLPVQAKPKVITTPATPR